MLGRLYSAELSRLPTMAVQRMLASAEGRQGIAKRFGEAALHLAQCTIGYGLPVFRLAATLAGQTDPAHPTTDAELFRRFMFLTYRSLRPSLFEVMTHEGWQRLAAAIEDATLVRLRAMRWAEKE